MKILIVDDEPEMRELLIDELQRIFPRVTMVACATAKEGETCLEEGGIRGLLTDGLDGEGFTLLFKARAMEIPVILISGVDDFVKEAQTNGFVALMKPAKRAELEDVLRRVFPQNVLD